jgi:hypothetical protein
MFRRSLLRPADMLAELGGCDLYEIVARSFGEQFYYGQDVLELDLCLRH